MEVKHPDRRCPLYFKGIKLGFFQWLGKRVFSGVFPYWAGGRVYLLHLVLFYWVKLQIPVGYAHLVWFKREVKGFCINPKLCYLSLHILHIDTIKWLLQETFAALSIWVQPRVWLWCSVSCNKYNLFFHYMLIKARYLVSYSNRNQLVSILSFNRAQQTVTYLFIYSFSSVKSSLGFWPFVNCLRNLVSH